MLTIICGEDSITSRNYYSSLKKNYQDKDFQVIEIPSSELENIPSWMGESRSLFKENKVFFTVNVNKRVSRKLNLKINKVVDQIIKDKTIEVVDWEEEISSRSLKFPKGVTVKEFKPSQNIFKLQDALYPGNLKSFLSILNQLTETVDENFVFIMLIRHLKNLLLVKTGQSNSKLQSWQIAKLRNQASKWRQDKLINFYDAFHKIDVSQKTSTNPYSLKKSLDILSCYYL
ncbi:hypothetical protein CO008_00970 [Candidatus Roizmanbacteria bacterium CG_4_8_14_3_um_filter_36_12]|nr:MAG: hypothetical protein CO008_00970 [Candidatus Roizmanbacteria bacterium CG_4_8_14_3_um_filter_36_12]